jgi:hypothetical protein
MWRESRLAGWRREAPQHTRDAFRLDHDWEGTDALGQFFRESTKTVMVNCYGCQYQGIRYPAPNSSIMLEVSRGDHRRLPRVVPARVIWVRRPQAYRTLYHVGIEFEVPGNVWDIACRQRTGFPAPRMKS